MADVLWTLKPHPACTEKGEIIDILSEGDLPWASIHIDALRMVNQQDNQLYNDLYYHMKTVKVRLEIIE